MIMHIFFFHLYHIISYSLDLEKDSFQPDQSHLQQKDFSKDYQFSAKNNNFEEFCFYINNKSQCPPNILEENQIKINNLIPNIFSNIYLPIKIHVIEPIKLTSPFKLSGSNKIMIFGNSISGTIELSNETTINIEDSTQTSFIINWSVKSQKISKIQTKTKTKSIYIQIDDQINSQSSYKINFYTGKETNITLSQYSSQNPEQNKNYYTVKNLHDQYFVKVFSYFEAKKSYKELPEGGKCGENVNYTFSSYNSKGSLTLNIFGTGEMYNYSYVEPSPFSDVKKDVYEVIVNKGVTSVGAFSFYYFNNIRQFKLSDTVEKIHAHAFHYCNYIHTKTFSQNLTYIGEYAFYEAFYFTANIQSSRFLYLPDSLKIVDSFAFLRVKDCEIFLPTSLSYIGDCAFESSKIKNIHISENLTHLGRGAFAKSIYLEKIKVDETNDYFSDIDGVLFTKNAKELILYPSCKLNDTYEIPNSVTKIQEYSFSYNKNIINLTLPNSVTIIGNYSFYQSESLASINIPSNVVSIGFNAFDKCYRLNCEIVIPKSIKNISDSIFSECSRLEKITIPDDVTRIGNFAFNKCSNLISVNIPRTINYIGNYAFYQCYKLSTINCVFDEIFYIGNYAFSYCNLLTNLTIIKETKCTINSYAFSHCPLLTHINLPDIEKIDEGLFEYCTSLTNINIPQNVNYIGSQAFYNCKSLSSIKFPSSLRYIGPYSFSNCSSITKLIIPNNVNETKKGAFIHCSSLQYVSLSNNIAEVSKEMFSYCNQLELIIIPKNVEKIDEKAFYGCQNLRNATVLGSLYYLGDKSFSSCPKFNSFYYLGERNPPLCGTPFDYSTDTTKNAKIYTSLHYNYEYFCYQSDYIKTDLDYLIPIDCTIIDPNCLYCNSSKICTQCDQGYNLESNTCIPDCSEISECLKCEAPNSCKECEKGFSLSSDKKSCISNNIALCNVNGCSECYENDYNYCMKCNSELHFVNSINYQKLCSCEIGYELNEDKCVLSNIILPPTHEMNDIDITNKDFVRIKDNEIELYPQNFENKPTETIFSLTIPMNVNKIKIGTETNNEIQINVPKNNEKIIIDAVKSLKPLTIYCPEGANLIINNSDNNINIKGNKKIKFEAQKINKIILDTEPNIDKEPIEIDSEEPEFEITEIQVFGKQKLIGSNNLKKTKCNTLILEGGSEFVPENISIETAKIESKSILKINNQNINVSHFIVYYNISQFYYNSIPILFKSPFPDLSSSDVLIIKKNQKGILNDDNDEKFIASQFIGENELENEKACKNMILNDKSIFTKAKCVINENSTNYNLVLYNDKKDNNNNNNKKGLSPGGIAGIVIACIVVIALIIVLVFFLVIKKKNNDNSNTGQLGNPIL